MTQITAHIMHKRIIGNQPLDHPTIIDLNIFLSNATIFFMLCSVSLSFEKREVSEKKNQHENTLNKSSN